EDLSSVALGAGGKGALIGGDAGLVLTLVDGRFEPTHPSDYFDADANTPGPGKLGGVVGVGLLPGDKAGDVEAGTAAPSPGDTRTPAPGAILHYTNDSSNPLLTAGADRAAAVSDAPTHESGEIDIAAFGKSDCQTSSASAICPEFTGTNRANEVIAR